MTDIITPDDAKPYSVTIPNQGTLTGYILKSPITQTETTIRFAKVPYAEYDPSTKHENRWTKPKSISSTYQYTNDYKNLGLRAPQPEINIPAIPYPKLPSDELIQWSNIWIPKDDSNKPELGWPVLIFLHGGWLQYGEPGIKAYPIDQFEDFKQKYILVVPGYRLNVFGFLSSEELFNDVKVANFGFWDQREAIEWSFKYIKYFGGDPEKITLGGLSAGSYSTFYQLAYELYHPEVKQIIKQVVFFSNGVFVQPKSIKESQRQFDEIVVKLGITNLSFKEQLKFLKNYKAEDWENFIPTLDLHTFRAVTDDDFISSKLIPDLINGEFAKRLTSKNVNILIGEVVNEPYIYSLLNTPKSKKELKLQINNYYSDKIVEPLWELYKVEEFLGDEIDSDEYREKLRVKFGQIIADCQVYSSSRGFLNQLVTNGFPKENIFRYRSSFRGEYLSQTIDKNLAVVHGTDLPIWFYYKSIGLKPTETELLKPFVEPFLQFLNFDIDDVRKNWPNDAIDKYREFKKDGTIEYVDDPQWDWGLKVSKVVYDTQ